MTKPDNLKRYRLLHKERCKLQSAEWRAKSRLKRRCHQQVSQAVKANRLIIPDRCSRCGQPCRPDAHHEDYSKPLDVAWLCKQCHYRKHPNGLRQCDSLKKGELNWRARLKPIQVLEIRRRHAIGETQTSLAKEFDLTVQGVNRIIHRLAWRHL